MNGGGLLDWLGYPVLLAANLSALPVPAGDISGSVADAGIQHVAYFDDGSDKQSIVPLREKDARGEPLSDEEEAILQAANRVGWIYWPKCKLGGNAFLVKVGGKDAVITSAHQVLEAESGLFKNNCSIEKLKDGTYYPDISYIDTIDGKPPPDSFVLRTVPIEDGYLPNLQEVSGRKVQFWGDWLIGFLKVDITDERAPDGRTRGYVTIAESTLADGHLHDGFMIGFDPKFDKARSGRTLAYQKCSFHSVGGALVTVSCDTVDGTSSSLLGRVSANKIVVDAINTAHPLGLYDDTAEFPLPKYPTDWNMGLSLRAIEAQMKSRYGLSFDR